MHPLTRRTARGLRQVRYVRHLCPGTECRMSGSMALASYSQRTVLRRCRSHSPNDSRNFLKGRSRRPVQRDKTWQRAKEANEPRMRCRSPKKRTWERRPVKLKSSKAASEEQSRQIWECGVHWCKPVGRFDCRSFGRKKTFDRQDNLRDLFAGLASKYRRCCCVCNFSAYDVSGAGFSEHALTTVGSGMV